LQTYEFAKDHLLFVIATKSKQKGLDKMQASARSSQSGNRLTKVADVDNFVVDYPDWKFTPVRGPPILSGQRSCTTANLNEIKIIILTNDRQGLKFL